MNKLTSTSKQQGRTESSTWYFYLLYLNAEGNYSCFPVPYFGINVLTEYKMALCWNEKDTRLSVAAEKKPAEANDEIHIIRIEISNVQDNTIGRETEEVDMSDYAAVVKYYAINK